ncbi:MAG: zinc-ribbon domain containing protein [Candidatus Melainabacteria bacterium]|nr:zinc-ribbon domain containing protein [Candidatus Melainabacteria bacterium]
MEKSTTPDKQLTCRDCRNTFVFSGAEQDFFKEKGLGNEPKRCPNCRLLSRSQRPGSVVQQTAEVPCSGCERPTRVPFLPNGHKPVLCNSCFYSKKATNSPPDNDEHVMSAAS